LADSLADDGKNEAAERLYREVLRQDPNLTQARERLKALTAAPH
jgi:TolA-binding protein